jgi:hypothetical protein
MKGYCMKEKKMVEMKDVSSHKTKKGTTMNKGKCSHCGTTVCAISK